MLYILYRATIYLRKDFSNIRTNWQAHHSNLFLITVMSPIAREGGGFIFTTGMLSAENKSGKQDETQYAYK